MKISVYALSIDIFTNALGNLSAILEKGVAHATARKFDSNVLVASRLAPDMLPLSKQVQIACDLAKNSAARLAGGFRAVHLAAADDLAIARLKVKELFAV